MVDKNLNHIFIRTEGSYFPYTSKPKKIPKKSVPIRNRLQHGEMLNKKFTDAWGQAKELDVKRKAISLPTKNGTYVEFYSSADYELAIKSLEHRKSGIRLLNVRTDEVEGKKIRKATVYVPDGKENYFLKKIKLYLEKDTVKGEPQNNPLVASMDNILLAVLESFWTSSIKLIPDEQPEWCEIWLSSDNDEDEIKFRTLATKIQIQLQKETLYFPERRVILIKGNKDHLQELITSSPNIAEIRRATEIISFFIDMQNKDQIEWATELRERVKLNNESDVYICILDTGVNNGHILLEPLLSDSDRYSYSKDWGRNDHSGHGTGMSGIAGYGDLQNALESRSIINISHKLESFKIIPPLTIGANEPRLYGAITSQAISNIIINNPNRKRIICMAITAPKYQTGDGSPSSWSAGIDELTSGFLDDEQKLFIISAGNVRGITDWKDYPYSNLTQSVENPGQSWNALTVGAYTEKFNVDKEKHGDMAALAPYGGLSPFSSTSHMWDNKWPIKPDIVLEGGNILNSFEECDDLSLLTTSYSPIIKQFQTFNATSGAAAKAAWMAAKIQSEYPDAWPETIRALLVHTANWTDEMKRQFLHGSGKKDYRNLMRVCGYGVPNLDQSLWCLKNKVNLIIQSELQPFDKSKDGKRFVTKDMHLHELPWPKDVLLGLGETNVTMRVTLSYFIEPGAGEIGWKDRYRYASCALRFDTNGMSSKEAFMRKISAAIEAEDESESGSVGVNWLLGPQNRHLGSIHSDIWSGSASLLATSNIIGIYPAIGWWRERAWLGRWNKKLRYSLIVSLITPEESVDLYTPIITKIKVETKIQI